MRAWASCRPLTRPEDDPSVDHPAYYDDDFGQEVYSGGRGYYKYMWYGQRRGADPYDFIAEGNKGQFIYVSPHRRLIIVRNGAEFGIPSHQWIELFYDFATALED